MELTGRTVLVTGASRGIGLELARSFAALGARVVAVARSPEPLEALARTADAIPVVADLTDERQVLGLLDRVEDVVGPVDVLVNNAGIDQTEDFLTADPGDLARVVRLNLTTPMQLARLFTPGMVQRGRGHVVNMSSVAGSVATSGMAAYSATKAGLTQFTSGLRTELRGLGVGTTLVALGPVQGDMWDHVTAYQPMSAAANRLARLHLLPRLSTARVAAAVTDAISRDKANVWLPRRAYPFLALPEVPRRVGSLLLAGVPNRPDPDPVVAGGPSVIPRSQPASS